MFLIIISIIALLIFLLSMDLSWSNVVSDNRNDLVFEGRNQEYGAYKIRHEHHMNVFYSMLLAIGLIGGGLLASGAFTSRTSSFNSKLPDEINIPIFFPIDDVERIEPKPEEKPQQRHVQLPSGPEDREVTVVDNGDETMQSDLDLSNKKRGNGDEGETGDIIEPYDPGKGDPTDTGNTTAPPKKKVHDYVKNKPEFPGGDAALMKFMNERVRYNSRDIDLNVEGTIYLSFVVDATGEISGVVITRNIHNGDHLAGMAVDAILSMPKWIPGNNGDEPLAVKMTLPLKVELRK